MAVKAVTKEVKLAASQALGRIFQIPLYKALPPCVSILTPSRRKAFVPKFLSFLSHFVVLVGVAILRSEQLLGR